MARRPDRAGEWGGGEGGEGRPGALRANPPEPLRHEIFRRLPPYHRSLFPGRAVEPPDAALPGLGVLAERLIREATR